jgi:hypothetical protein
MKGCSNMKDEGMIWARQCANYPELYVKVSGTPIGTYRVTFIDTEADAVISQRIFNKCVNATEFAHTLVNQS